MLVGLVLIREGAGMLRGKSLTWEGGAVCVGTWAAPEHGEEGGVG